MIRTAKTNLRMSCESENEALKKDFVSCSGKTFL